MPLAPPFQLLDRYDVIEEIGRGGHAVVFRARDRSLDRDVAVKVLREEATAPGLRARFTQEIQVLARLQHPHILHVHDSGLLDGLPFVVMELAPQQSLAHRLSREAQLPIRDAVEIAREVGSALAYAHSRGVLHRDVKPENILLGSGGAILADFGIARLTESLDISRITDTGEAVGTLQYMSPEQLCAEPADARSDQYSLACVLYEMLAGVRPHVAATFEALRALRLMAQQQPLGLLRPSVPPMLEEVIAQAMAVTPADRFRNMDEFLAALEQTRTAELAGGFPSGPRVTGPRAAVGSSGDARLATPSARRTVMPSYDGSSPDGSTPDGSSPDGSWPDRSVPRAVSPSMTPSRRRVGMVAGVLLAGAAGAWLWRGRPAEATPAAAGALAVSLTTPADSLGRVVETRVASELAAWTGVELVSSGGSVRIAPTVTSLGDSLQLRLQVRSAARGDSALSVVRLVARGALPTADSVVASMVREALAQRPANEVPGLDGLPGRSLPALRAYVQGHALLRAGQLDSAAQAFREARDAEPRFAAARFWAAQSAAWNAPKAVDRWKSDADEAVRLGTLRGVDSLLAVGLQRMAAMQFPEACAAYREATAREAESFVGWYGLGRCQQLDSLVVVKRGVAQFRSSVGSVLQAYRTAIERAPTSPWLAALFEPVAAASFARAGQVRAGRVAPAARVFALPGLDADTFAFEPVDSAAFVRGAAGSVPTTWSAATRHGALLLSQLTERWTARFAMSADAWYQRASALEFAGSVRRQDAISADAALDSAASRKPGGALSLNIDVARVRLALRRGALDSALTLAQEALRAKGSGANAPRSRLVGLAALAGRDDILQQALSADYDLLPAGVREPLTSWHVNALLGQCEAVRERRQLADAAVRASYPAAELDAARRRLVLPLLRLSLPCLGLAPLREFMPSETPLDPVYTALALGDRRAATAALDAVQGRRRGATNAAVSWDYLFAEAWLRLQLGDTAAARTQILSGLNDLSLMSSTTLTDAEAASGLRRSLQLLSVLPSPGKATEEQPTNDRWRRMAARFTTP